VYYDGGIEERQSTVITAQWGPLSGKRIVRGRESECDEFYGEAEQGRPAPESVSASPFRVKPVHNP
jgi:hypothetical protein